VTAVTGKFDAMGEEREEGYDRERDREK